MPTTSARIAEHHRALSNPTRVRVLEFLRRADVGTEHGPDAAAIAEGLGLHISTARTHLGILESSGLVTSRVEERRVRGRPRRLYRAEDLPQTESGKDRAYLDLADTLASTLNEPDLDGVSLVTQAGVRWGRQIMGEASKERSFARVRDRLHGLLEDLGYAPSPGRNNDIDLRRCPIVEVARDNREVVCGLHHGVLVGAAQALGYEGEIRLEPFATDTTCRVAFAD